MEKEIKINVPNGYEIDKENSTFECIKFKPIKNKLPKTWEEYCKTHPIRRKEVFIDESSGIHIMDGGNRNIIEDKTVLPNKEYAEAIIALCQLIQLRDCYNNGWVPQWCNTSDKFTIYGIDNGITKNINTHINRILAFKTSILRDEFLNNFRDLIEIAKPLI